MSARRVYDSPVLARRDMPSSLIERPPCDQKRAKPLAGPGSRSSGDPGPVPMGLHPRGPIGQYASLEMASLPAMVESFW
jgi:hypothetical protein